MDFAIAEAMTRRIRPSFPAYGHVRPRAAGEAAVVAPLPGRLVPTPTAPKLGDVVEAGRPLATVIPRLAEQGDPAALEQAVADARIALGRAKTELERLEGLLAQGAVAERRVVEARFDVDQAKSNMGTARRRLKQAKRVTRGDDASERAAVVIPAPLTGTITEVDAIPGAFVSEGAPLYRIIDVSTVWLEIHVAEAHAPKLADPRGVWLELDGFERPLEVGPEGVVTVGAVMDERSRTVPLFVEVPNLDGQLRVGMFAEVHVLEDDPRQALTTPVSSIVYESGLPVVYVMLGGETFERRAVRLGVRDGAWIEVLEGIEQGEHVVSRGAWAVRLAGSGDAVPAHGHAH